MKFKEYIEPKLQENLESVKKQVLDNKMPFGMIIDGSPGNSKTTTAAMIGKFIQPNFNVEKQIGRGTEQFIKAYNYTIDGVKAPYKVCIYDEANDSDKSSSLNKLQRILNQILAATTRQEKVIIIVVLHRFYRLDEKFFDNGLIHMVLNMYGKKNDEFVKFKAYDLDCILWMMNLIKRNKVPKKPKVYGSTMPNFGGRILAPPKSFIGEVERYSKAGKDLLRQKATREILASNYYTVSVLASMLGVTKSQIQYQIDKHDLKRKYLRERSGRIFYYDKELFAVLKGILSEEERSREASEASTTA